MQGCAFGVSPHAEASIPYSHDACLQSYEPGEQKRRDYTWSIDPSNYRFGQKGGNIPYNGVSSGTPFLLASTPSRF